MSYNSGPGPVPERWLTCPRKSTKLIADRFLAFKTPLNKRFDSQVPAIYRFTPQMLLESTKNYKYRIGLWIDLTNTSRFYDKEEVERGYDDETEVSYVKIKCRGHGEAPSDEHVSLFLKICSNFIKSRPKEMIGVHCTHGFNRTGFMIVCFLVQELDWSLDAAIYAFAKAREPGIYKQDYIAELYKKFDPESAVPRGPPRPAWCFDTGNGDEDDDGEDGGDDHRRGEKRKFDSHRNEGRNNKRRHQNELKKNPQFMEGVDGVVPVEDPHVVERVQTAAQHMCGWEGHGFPGSQPVSLDRENIQLLSKEPYTVSWKADGTRYMMAILGEGEVYMLDRDNFVYEVSNLRFVNRKNLDQHLKQTLLDGEMVIDRYKGANIARYLVYDVICVEGIDIMKFPFSPARMRCIEADIIKPRHQAMELQKISKDLEPFSVRAKMFCPLDQTSNFLGEKFIHQLTHEPDGLIFQPCRDHYIPGQSPRVLKWKPPSHNSIDFRLKIEKEEGEGIVTRKVGNLYVGQLSRPFAQLKSIKGLEEYNNKIIECRYEDKKWIFMRERTDKSFPNSVKTAQAVWNSIRYPVNKDDLLTFIEQYRFRPERDIMPPPSHLPPVKKR